MKNSYCQSDEWLKRVKESMIQGLNSRPEDGREERGYEIRKQEMLM